MSIKNIIQQENDLQEMSTQSLANYLNNPTGQYNPYLVAGELQRKEAFAKRQMTEAPQGTVVDELVATAAPMGGMPMGGMPQMPQPRPEEVMVSDTITETGIANLPAPNIGQNYAGGGIVGYDNGGEVEEGGFIDYLDPIIEGASLIKWPVTSAFWPTEMGDGTLDSPEYQELIDEQNTAQNLGLAGVGAVGTVAAQNKLNKKKVKTPKIKPKSRVGALGLGIKSIYEAAKNKLKPKKLNKKEKAQKIKDDKAAQKAKDKDTRTRTQKIKDKSKELYGSTSPDKGPLTRAGIATLKGIGQGAGPLTRFVGRGLTKYPVETGLGAYGAYKAYDYFDPFGTKQKELEEKLAKEGRDSMEMHRQTRLRRERDERVQAELDAKQAAKDRQREKEMYLALALGGAKTMAGQSPFALSNVGEGLGAGVGAIAAYDQNEMERVAASQAATTKAQQDMELALMDLDMKYRGEYVNLIKTEEYLDFVKQVEQALEDGEIAPPKDGSMTGEQVKQAKINDFVQNRIGLAPRKSREARINNQLFQAME